MMVVLSPFLSGRQQPEEENRLSLSPITNKHIMKGLRTRHTALLLFTFLLASVSLSAQTGLQQKLSEISAITETQPLESTEFSEKYVTYFTQPLDHRHPKKGSFRQRVIVAHAGFDRPTVIITEGYGAAYALKPQYREELSRLLNANMVFVEYRYFLESTPEPKDWRYLTAESSADDLHAVTTAFKNIYPGKWIATGISKGGQTALLYRTFYPDDVEILKRKAALLPLFEKYCTEQEYKFRAPIEEIYDYSVLEYSFALWQWGTPVGSIPLPTATDAELIAHLLAISDPSYFTTDSTNASFFVQAARELGYYGYDTRPFKKYLSIKSGKGYLHRLMLSEELKDMPFDKTLSRKIKGFLQKNDPKMIFIYGENDPWTAAGVTWLKEKKNIHVFIQPGGSHLARISTLPEKEKEEVMKLLNEWLR